MKLTDLTHPTIIPYSDEEVWDESDIEEVPMWESAKKNKCTLSEQEQKEITSLLEESLNNDDFVEVDWI